MNWSAAIIPQCSYSAGVYSCSHYSYQRNQSATRTYLSHRRKLSCHVHFACYEFLLVLLDSTAIHILTKLTVQTAPQIKKFVTSFSTWRSGFEPHVALGRFFLQVLLWFSAISIIQPIFLTYLLI